MTHSRLAVSRAGDMSKLLDALDEIIGSHDPEYSLQQLLDRMLHYCDVCGRDFEEALTEAKRWHENERAGE